MFLYLILNVPLISWMEQKFTHMLVFVDRKGEITAGLSVGILEFISPGNRSVERCLKNTDWKSK